MSIFSNIEKILLGILKQNLLKPTAKEQNEKGFSLIEALVATAVVGIGFVGVYSLIALSEQFTKWAIGRQKLQMIANQILEVIDADVDNITSYNVSLTNCVDPGATTTTSLLRTYEWCVRTADELGAAGATNTRSITVTSDNPVAGKTSVLIILEAFGGKSQIIMQRTYGTS